MDCQLILSRMFRATVMAKISYRAPAWTGLSSAQDRTRLDALFSHGTASDTDAALMTSRLLFDTTAERLFKEILSSFFYV